MGNLVALQFQNSGYNVSGDFSHGNYQNAILHKQMMEKIANEVCDQKFQEYERHIEIKITEIVDAKVTQMINDVLRAIEYDIQSVTHIGFDGCKEVFEGKKAQKYISDQIYRAIERNLRQER